MINLKANPFFLNDEAIKWVEETIQNMTTEEKIGQLFCPIVFTGEEAELKKLMEEKHVGGILYREGAAEEIQRNHAILQKYAKIPLLTSANLESGGNGSAAEGTFYGKPMQVAATNDAVHAYQLGKVACSEGAAVGVNWSFAPIVDIDYNFRNPITNIRTFGSNPDRVLEMGKAYLKGAQEAGVATSVKHFPGDGCDERDQHLLTSVNDMGCDLWDQTYGKVYQGMIEAGTLTIMAGHIALPAYEEKFTGQPVKKIVPATLSKEILNNLLREQLGFNGMIVTDATPMVGFCAAKNREEAVPYAIAAGCDMFLFNRDLAEDIDFMRKGYETGILTEERLTEALTRILATKAALNLHNKQKEGTLVPGKEALSILQNETYVSWAKDCADKAITLVKDTQQLLPLSVNAHKRVLVQILGGFPSNDRVYGHFEKKLTEEGFEVTKYIPENFGMPLDNVTTFKQKYDLVIYIGNIDNASNKTVARINWHTMFGLGNNMPWFVEEVPTLFVSVGNPYQLLDAPMVKTYINGYSNSTLVIDAVIEKIMGRSAFVGVSPVDPFCGRLDTHF